MNKRQIIILWIIALALGAAVAAVKFSQEKSIRSATERVHGETLLKTFPAENVTTIEIKGARSEVTLVRKDSGWVVAQRDDFPANATYVNDFLRTLGEVKVIQGMEAGPSFAPRFGMDESATKADEHGIVATFKDAAGKDIAKVGLGKNIEGGAPASPMNFGGGSVGRYVRNYADETGFYAVSEMFPAVSDEPQRWLATGFISPENIKSVTVSEPGKSEPAWKVTREDENAEYQLADAAPGDVLDATFSGSLKSLFSYARFEDVVPADQVAARSMGDDKKRTATIETVEGFTYTVTFVPEKPTAAAANPDDADAPPPTDDNFLMTVDVAAEIPASRKIDDGEKPADAPAKDAAFDERHKALTEKLAKEKALAGKTFVVSKMTVEALLKERGAILVGATPAEDEEPGLGNLQQLPGGMIARPPATATTPPIEAVTPPISVPPADQPAEAEDDGEAALGAEPVQPEMDEEAAEKMPEPADVDETVVEDNDEEMAEPAGDDGIQEGAGPAEAGDEAQPVEEEE